MSYRPPASAFSYSPSRNDTHTLLAHPDSRFAGAGRNKAANPSRCDKSHQALHQHRRLPLQPAYNGDILLFAVVYAMQDIAEAIGHDRVARVVDRFYDRIQQHPTLSKPFERVHDWPTHKAILTHFWWVTLGGKRYMPYSYEVARKHAESGFTPALLQDWLALFREIIDAEIPDDLATGWIERAERIGLSLNYLHETMQRGQQAPSGLYRPA